METLHFDRPEDKTKFLSQILEPPKQESKKNGQSKNAGSGATRSHLSEADEDQALMKLAENEALVVRITDQPSLIVGGKLRPYQVEGLNWLANLFENKQNGILADEMGLGKTLQTISILAYIKESRGVSGPHIVIVPKSTVSNWINEFARWCPSFRVGKLLGSKDERAIVCSEIKKGLFDVVIASYESCLKESRTIVSVPWQYLIIDEAHRIKNEASSLSKLVRVPQTQHKLLITGTPLQNNLHELWSLLNFIFPEIFDDSKKFDEMFNIESNDAKNNVIQRLHAVLKPFMLRRIKKDVERDLPPKREIRLYIGMTELQRDWYVKMLQKDIHSLNAIGGADRVRLVNILMQLRKVCNHPYLFDGAEPGPPFIDGPHIWNASGKMFLLNKLLPKLQEQGSRVLIFCQMTRMLDILEDYLILKRLSYCRIDGSTSGEDREQSMERFNEPNSSIFCFLLSTRAGGLGINLQTADTVILFDSDWNPQVDLQAMDRAHRIGQKKEVRVFRFITEGTIEEKIVERADRKLFLDAAVIQQGRLADKHSQLSKNELMAMVTFGADAILSNKGGTLSDEEIEALLERCEKRTIDEQDRLSNEMKHNLANFSLDGNAEINIFTFEGEDYRSKKKSPAFLPIQLPQRDRKRVAEQGSMLSFKEKKKKVVNFPDYQFCAKKRLEEIYDLEFNLSKEKSQTMVAVKELKTKVSRARRMEEDSNTTETQTSQHEALCHELESLQNALDSGHFDLPSDVIQEKEFIISSTFTEWTKKDFKLFVDVIEKYGKQRASDAKTEISNLTGKDISYVDRYYTTFFERAAELSDWSKIQEKIEKGDKRIKREDEIKQLVSNKVAEYGGNPLQSLSLNYGSSNSGNTKNKYFTEDEDAFLLVELTKYGYGAWDKIYRSISESDFLAFDWYLKTRSIADIQKRCDTLIRLIEREVSEPSHESKKQRRKDYS